MYVGGQVRPLRLFEVLARNRQSALELSGRSTSALVQTHRMFTIPPRQQLPITRRLVVRARRVTRARIRIRVIPIRWYKTYARETCSKRTLEKKLVKHSHRIQISPHKRLYTQRERHRDRERENLLYESSSFPLAHDVVVILLSSWEVETLLRSSPFDGFIHPSLGIRFRGCVIIILFIGDDDDDDEAENAGTNSACWEVLHFDDERERKG